MKLRNKKTGEIIETQEIYENLNGKIRMRKKGEEIQSYRFEYSSLAELNKDWDDYEEPTIYWYLGNDGIVYESSTTYTYVYKLRKQIGNYFETKKEAERAAEKLKAVKRLQDKGFRFTGFREGVMGHEVNIYAHFTNLRKDEINDAVYKNEVDLHLLFGGEE